MEIKFRKCQNVECGTLYQSANSLQKCCSAPCERKRLKAKQKQKESRTTERKRSDRLILMDLAKITFNAFIRERDKKEPCICCGKPLGNDYHAGHCFSGGGHAAVMFDEDNVNAQRASCNTGHAANMLTNYCVRLEEKIGKDAFELLRAKAYEVKKWEVPELQSIIREYKQKLKQLKSK